MSIPSNYLLEMPLLKVRKNIDIFIKALLAGGAISLGGLAYICSQNRIVGSLLFSTGLFLILVWKLNLFTGKICLCFEEPKVPLLELVLTYVGNFLGCLLLGYLMRISVSAELVDSFRESFEVRLTNTPLEIILLGFFCNICIYAAVQGYLKLQRDWERVLSTFLGVSIFILCGFEHCIADIFYLTLCNLWSWNSLPFILCVTIGNILGGLTIPLIRVFRRVIGGDK